MKLLLCLFLLLFSVQIGSSQSCTLSFTTIDSLPSGSVWVTAHFTGTNPTFLWDNGSTNATIEVTEPSVPTVFATNDEGCTFGSGVSVECETVIRAEGNSLKAYKLVGGTGLTFLWNTGETTQTIYPTQSGNYCVTVTGSNDCSGGLGLYTNSNCFYFEIINTCSTTILYNTDNTLTANAVGTAPFTYQWSPGNDNTQTIDPGQPGSYCVTTTDAMGCVTSDCQYLYDPAQCNVAISFYPDSTIGGWMYAETQDQGQGWGDWNYLWSNGSTDSAVQPMVGGSYCVTVTNVHTGCSASNCYWYWPDSLCFAVIQQDSIGLDNAYLSVSGGPFTIVDYQWSNGGTNASNTVSVAGWHTVTVTNSEGCIASASYYLYQNETIVVTVQFPDSTNLGNNGVHALVYLIEYDTAQGGMLTAVDTAETQSWNNSWGLAQFHNVASGHYLIKAALLPNSNGYQDHLPSYFQSAIFWDVATPLTFHTFGNSWQTCNILLVPGQNPGGPGFVGGLVIDGANIQGGGGESFFNSSSGPIAGLNVVLTLADGTPVMATTTDANGEYRFENIAWGTYTITLDIPGLPMASAIVTIGPDNPSISNINFKVDENSIALPVKEADLKKTIEVFPNPAQDVLFIETPENAELTLADAQGKEVLHIAGTNSKTKLFLGNLTSGLYFLTVRSAGTIETIKVIKQ